MIALLAFRAVMGGEIFSDPLGWLLNQLLMIPAIIIGITFHEFSHAFVAYKLGDMTPKFQRRVNLNPVRHMDPVGFIALIAIGFGWGRPVEVNPYAFRRRRLSNFLVDIAGVTMNFILALLFMGVVKLIYVQGFSFMPYAALPIIIRIVYNIVSINLVLMIFNLLPVPPLDGFGVITEIFNLRDKPFYHRLYSLGFPILMALIFFNITGMILTPAVNGLMNFLMLIWFGGAL